MHRKQAIEAGLKFYAGRPCKHCGNTQRNVSDYNCTECGRARARIASAAAKEDGRRKLNRQRYESGAAGKAARARYNKTKITNGDRWRYSIQTKYGITEEQYNTMLYEQHFCCKICGQHVDTNGKKFAVDHCHATGRVRSLLCHKCNVALGHFNDDIEIVQKAIDYLKEHLVK